LHTLGVASRRLWPFLAAAPPPRRCLHPGAVGGSLAGHNRWSKVRNVKGPRDAARSRLFQRLAQLLRSAARGGLGVPPPNQSPHIQPRCRQGDDGRRRPARLRAERGGEGGTPGPAGTAGVHGDRPGAGAGGRGSGRLPG
ncbi:TACO1 oxidase, partial [Alcedo cyanopectus]|nr:TACO1 oxidase [Ceyx cyanopectus]